MQNGNDTAQLGKPAVTATQAAQQQANGKPTVTIEQLIDPQIRQVIGTMVRGLMVSAPGVPTHVLLESIARQTGNLIAGALSADLATTLRLRKGFQDAFHAGITAVPVQQPPTGPQIQKLKG